MDSEVKEVLVVFDDASIRNRKQRVRGGYTSHTCMTVASSNCLTQCLPEKQFEHHTGHCTSNVVHGVKALSPTDLWHTNRSEKVEILGKARTVEVTPEAAEERNSVASRRQCWKASSPLACCQRIFPRHAERPLGQSNCGFVLWTRISLILCSFSQQPMGKNGDDADGVRAD